MFENEKKLSVAQGTHSTSTEQNVVLSAVLGSCVAVCAYDELAGVGGMNHILLPGLYDGSADDQTSLYGANLMELLLNELFSKSALKKRLKFKLFGGSSLLNSSLDVGASNIKFITSFIDNEGYEVVSSSLGGSQGRQIEFHPVSGRSRQRFIVDRPCDAAHNQPLTDISNAGEIELF